MKKILSYVLSGIIGGVLVLGGNSLLNQSKLQQEIAPVNSYEAMPVSSDKYDMAAMPFDFSEAAENSLSSVVHIKAVESYDLAAQRYRNRSNRSPFEDFFGGNPFFDFGPRVKQGSGSGVIISSDGYIVTNNHVVDFADELEVTLHDGRKFKAHKVGLDSKSDLAVIKLEGGSGLKPIVYGDSDKIKVGQWVLAVGNPFDLTSTVTAGIVSAKGRDLGIIKDKNAIEDFIQTDAAVNPGNSGGALVDMQGKLIGINTAIATPTGTYAGYSFAIPVNMMKKIVDELIENGIYYKPALGVVVYEVDKTVAAAENLDVSQGVAIAELSRGGSAQLSGLLPRDVIQDFDGKKVTTVPDLVAKINDKKVGDKVVLKINRGGEDKLVEVVLKPAPVTD